MKTSVAIALLVCLAGGCAQLPKDHKVASLRFRSDPVDHRAEEAIEQIEIIAPAARVHRVGETPTDWSAGISSGQDGVGECILNCAHQSFAEPDIHVFDRLVSFLLPQNDTRREAKVRVWITRGPLGPGRVVDLDNDDFILK